MTNNNIKNKKTNTVMFVISAVAASAILLSASGIVPFLSIPSVFANSANTGLVEPLYIYPYNNTMGTCTTASCFAWYPVNHTKSIYPNVPFFAVINPDNGPCVDGLTCSPLSNPDPNYQKGIANLTKSGVVSLGYVWTKNGGRPLASVESDIDHWVSWYKPYGIKGIMIDEMPHIAGQDLLNYYENLTNYIHSKGLTYSYGNPGTDVPISYQGHLDIMNIYEGDNSSGDLTNSTLQGNTNISGNPANWHTLYDKSTYSFVVYNQPPISQKLVQGKSLYVGLMFITDGGNTWNTMPSYLSSLMGYLNNTSVLSTIQAQDTSGHSLSVPIQIYQSGNLVRNGTTPFAYNETSGWQFNFTSSSICKWSYGSTTVPSHSIIVAPNTSTTYTATVGTPPC